jgi:hypothetical protein
MSAVGIAVMPPESMGSVMIRACHVRKSINTQSRPLQNRYWGLLLDRKPLSLGHSHMPPFLDSTCVAAKVSGMSEADQQIDLLL